jgi:hypothetical protein
MNSNRKRVALATGATMALVFTGASIVTAQTPAQNTQGYDAGSGALHQPGPGGLGDQGFGGRGRDGGFGGGFGEMDRGAGILAEQRQLVRQELTVDLGDAGGIVTRRIEHGTVSAVADGSLTITLATGESVSVTTDADTAAVTEDFTQRPPQTDAALTDVTAGMEVVVWSQSQDDGSFLASRVVMLPADTTSTDGATTPDASTSPDASAAPVA